ncbi:MAG: hypothetical protein QMC96_12210 [Methanomicrobiales archaeon]|nr:hypothetical protein [Methanomicrobiales archaeon]
MTDLDLPRESMLTEEQGSYVCRNPGCPNVHRCRFFYPSQAFIRYARNAGCEFSPMDVQVHLEREG